MAAEGLEDAWAPAFVPLFSCGGQTPQRSSPVPPPASHRPSECGYGHLCGDGGGCRHGSCRDNGQSFADLRHGAGLHCGVPGTENCHVHSDLPAVAAQLRKADLYPPAPAGFHISPAEPVRLVVCCLREGSAWFPDRTISVSLRRGPYPHRARHHFHGPRSKLWDQVHDCDGGNISCIHYLHILHYGMAHAHSPAPCRSGQRPQRLLCGLDGQQRDGQAVQQRRV
mmetsp:Transcript_28464/g.83202  ORF Transcript_28464/g.83202 Transcript_28464/m.83202 type:complete len:225 (+) Transcript_28464:333-1007(+)